jgi:hypothetical protein
MIRSFSIAGNWFCRSRRIEEMREGIALLISASLLVAAEKSVKPVSFPMKYEGGSLPLNDSGLKVFLNKEDIAIVQGKQNFNVPIAAITEVSYGNDVHRRVGAAVGVGIVTLGVGALLALAKTKKHYVGVTWENAAGDHAKGGVVFKVGKGEYRGFIAALEGLTGKKAVESDKGKT